MLLLQLQLVLRPISNSLQMLRQASLFRPGKKLLQAVDARSQERQEQASCQNSSRLLRCGSMRKLQRLLPHGQLVSELHQAQLHQDLLAVLWTLHMGPIIMQPARMRWLHKDFFTSYDGLSGQENAGSGQGSQLQQQQQGLHAGWGGVASATYAVPQNAHGGEGFPASEMTDVQL